MRRVDGFEVLASSLGIVDSAGRGDSPPVGVLSNSGPDL